MEEIFRNSPFNFHAQEAAIGKHGFGEPPPFDKNDGFLDDNPLSDEVGSHEKSESFSDLVIDYINKMLMEDDMDDKFDMLQSHPDLEATEKPFYEIIGEKYPPSRDRSDSFDGNRSPNSNSINGFSDHELGFVARSTEFLHQDDISDIFIQTLPASQFEKGVEEAKRFLPPEAKLVVEADSVTCDLRGTRQRSRHNDRSDLEEQRSSKQSVVSYEDPSVSSEMFDMVLLCGPDKFPSVISAIREEIQTEAAEKKDRSESTTAPKNGKARGKKKQPKKEVVDLETLLIHCAQSVASGEHQRAHELLRQIRQHSSSHGDASQRVAHYFADGLEARLAGTGTSTYHTLVSKRKTAADMLKAYRLYLAASPFQKIPYHFSITAILETIGNATRVHIVDYGIYFGFQWPAFLKMLSVRPGGPPKLRITGVDYPQGGFRPAEWIEETGHRLAEYANRFGVPFEYQAVASKLDEVKAEDLHLDEDEMLIVNCMSRLHILGDETMYVDCARDKFLKKIRELNPALFVCVCLTGSYGAPFFVSRFREALNHFSSLFGMLEMTVPREHEQRLLVERDLYGKLAIMAVACEGAERLERPETYKQTQVRCLRAGFEQLPINGERLEKAKVGISTYYHKDFSIDADGKWMILAWRGRVFVGMSAWKPRYD